MPGAIDVDERLDAIARATLEFAREAGPNGVTVRAVARRLAGSTTLITKYLPSRAALLANAFRYVSSNWAEDRDAALRGHAGFESLRALARWSLSTTNYDDAIRGLWLHALSSGHREVDGVDLPHLQARGEHAHIRSVVDAACPNDGKWLADTLFLAFRGFYSPPSRILSSGRPNEREPPSAASSTSSTRHSPSRRDSGSRLIGGEDGVHRDRVLPGHAGALEQPGRTRRRRLLAADERA